MGMGSHNSRMSTNNQSVSRFGAPNKFESRLSQNNMSRMSYKGIDNRPSHQKLFGNPNQRKMLPILIHFGYESGSESKFWQCRELPRI